MARSGDPSEVERLLVGRKLWVLNDLDGIRHFMGPYQVLSLKQVLPQGERTLVGPFGDKTLVERKRSLVQVYADPGGMKTIAAADIWAKDPGRSPRPW